MTPDQVKYTRIKAEMTFADGGSHDFASDRTRVRVSCIRSRCIRALRFAHHLEASNWFEAEGRRILAAHGQPITFPDETA